MSKDSDKKTWDQTHSPELNDIAKEIQDKIKNSEGFKSFQETARIWSEIKAQAMKKYNLSDEEFDRILLEAPELEDIAFADLVEQSITAQNDLLLGGLLTKIIKKSQQENRSIAEVVRDVVQELEKSEEPHIKINRPNSVEFPIDKINSNVWNLLHMDTGGQITFAAEKKGSKTQLDIVYSIDFDSLETKGIRITKRLQPFDKRVYIATAALFNAGNEIITITQIHYAMGNTTRPNNKQMEKIRSSLIKMISARITVDNTSEAEVYKKYGKFVYNGVLLPVEFVERYNVQGSLTEAAIHVFREPPLIAFSKQRKQVTTIPIKLLQSPVSKTDTNLAIDDYLIERIARMKRGSKNGNNKILYSTICENAHLTTSKQKQRLPGTVKKYLDYYKDCKKITEYKRDKDGVEITI